MGDDKGTEELPPHLRTRPQRDADWDLPTAWLLGTQLLASLRDMGITAIFDFDARDWMNAGDPIDLGSKSDEPCWIDFLADSGDSPRLVYQLAFLLQQEQLELAGETLPRGRALIFGGDTAYPIATRRRLLERVRAPFLWAREDLGPRAAPLDKRVTLVGLPGNHDYYNELTGFEPLFHCEGIPAKDVPLKDRVDLPGYKLAQHASYFALLLPCGWQFLGLDVERAEIDHRQQAYFAKVPASETRIVATSKPALVYHALSENAAELGESYDALGLPRSFAEGGVLKTGARLDLSGDTHTYERYWGTDGSAPLDAGAHPPDTFAVEPRANYASVVSGLGGAFHHPGQVRLGEITPRRAWPSEAESAACVGKRLIHPREMFQAGAVGVAGFLIAALCFALALIPTKDQPYVLDIVLTRDAWGGGSSDLMWTALLHLGIVAAIIGTIALMIGVAALALRWGRWLAAPVEDMILPTTWWGRATKWITDWRPVYALLHWLGGNARNMWGTLITLPAWLTAIAVWGVAIWGLASCRQLAKALDGFVPVYVVIVLLGVAMACLGFFVAGARGGLGRRLAFALLGLVTGFLIVWTPYAWTKLAVIAKHRWLVVLFLAYWPVRVVLSRVAAVSPRRRTRQLVAVIGFVALAAFYCLIPRYLVVGVDEPGAGLPAYGIPIAALLGAYSACLWMGWYFYVCLQFDAHGNEAGGGARVVEFAQFLRIRLTKGRAEVWVIAAEAGATEPIARLVDHFTVASPATAPAPPPAGG